MPFKNKEDYKKYQKEWRDKNKKARKDYADKYYDNNKEKWTRKIASIQNWKTRGVLSDDYEKLFDYYLSVNNCDNCGIELCDGIYGNNKKCLDHCHNTGCFRNILCHSCNIKRR